MTEHPVYAEVTERAPVAHRTASAIIVLAIWFGLVAGLSEVGLRTIQVLVLNQRIHLSHQFVWMAPIADVVLYGAVGLAVAAVARLWPRRIGVGTVVFLCMFVFVAAPLYMSQRLHAAAVLLLAFGIAYQSARWTRRNSGRLQHLVRSTLIPVAAVVLVMGVGVNGWLRWEERRRVSALPDAVGDPTNIVLIILDTVRAASLKLYGYGRETTPNLDRLASDALVFDRAIATAPWTLPSHASMFTGSFPDQVDADWRKPLGETEPTVAEVLSSYGYRTGGFSGNLLYATYETGLDRGFTRFVDYPISAGMVVASSLPARILANKLERIAGLNRRLVQRSAASVNNAFRVWLDENVRENRPFFAFLNYLDAHDPYLPSAPFDTLFGGIEPMPLLSFDETWTVEELERTRDAYDAEIASVDNQLGMLLDELDSRGLLDRTIVVVASDHGEHFGEHGLLYHANSLYMALLHVPLVIRRPGGGDGGRRIAEPVSLADLPATLLSLAGLPSERIPGEPVIDAAGNPRPARPARAFVSKTINMASWLPASRGDMVSATSASLHYIRNGDGREELYDYIADPDEARNLAASPEFRTDLDAMRRLAAGGAAAPAHARATGAGAVKDP